MDVIYGLLKIDITDRALCKAKLFNEFCCVDVGTFED